MSEKPQPDDLERKRENEPDAEELREGWREESGRRASTGSEKGDEDDATSKEEREARSE